MSKRFPWPTLRRHGVAQNGCAAFNLNWRAQATCLHSSAVCRRIPFPVAHPSRVLAIASSRSRTFAEKDCFGETPKVRAGLALTRETRALPGNTAATRSVEFRRRFSYATQSGRQLRARLASIASRYVVAEANRRRLEGCDAGKGCCAPE